MKKYVAIAVVLTLAGLGFRLFLALHLPNDEPDDGRLYARIAINILEHHSYSIETEDPFTPTLIRVPGYPVFIAGIYAMFGHNNNRAVRVVQAVLDTITCWLIALLGLAWAPALWPRDKRRRVLIIGLGLAVCCPFMAIYVTTILTETCTTLLASLCVLSASLAMSVNGHAKAALWWVLAGLSGGIATLFRPDSGLFVAAVGITLVIAGGYPVITRWRARATRESARVLGRTVVCGLFLSIGFAAALTPWAIRNERVFGLFQPIAPSQANMPGEFVPNGYIGWLRTWVDDVKYTETLEFPLDVGPIHIEQVPDHAFDSAEERDRVTALLERYNNANSSKPEPAPPAPVAPPPTPPATQSKGQPKKVEPQPPEEEESEEAEPSEEEEAEPPDEEEEPKPAVEMTPEIDAGFEEIARERIARHPLRQYVTVPFKRAVSLWFDTHSQYYPFQGELLPLSALDSDIHQQYWLPLFMLLTILYTALGLGGVLVMLRHPGTRKWVLLIALLILPRMALLARMENPEPRYAVEFFAFVVAAGSLTIAGPLWTLSARFARRLMRRSDSPSI